MRCSAAPPGIGLAEERRVRYVMQTVEMAEELLATRSLFSVALFENSNTTNVIFVSCEKRGNSELASSRSVFAQ